MIGKLEKNYPKTQPKIDIPLTTALLSKEKRHENSNKSENSLFLDSYKRPLFLVSAKSFNNVFDIYECKKVEKNDRAILLTII